MEKTEFLKRLEDIGVKFNELRNQFADFGKNSNEYVWTGHLLEHLCNLRTLIEIGFDSSISDDLKQSDLDYFQKNLDGLEKVLKAIRRSKNGTS